MKKWIQPVAFFLIGLILISSTGMSVKHHLCSVSGKSEVFLLNSHHCEMDVPKNDCCSSRQKKSVSKHCCEISQFFSKVDITAQTEFQSVPTCNLWVYLHPVFTLTGIIASEQLAPSLPFFYPDKIPVLSASDKMSMLQTMNC